jgi:hypothetical protein
MDMDTLTTTIDASEFKALIDSAKNELLEAANQWIDQLTQALVNFAAAVGAPDQYRLVLHDLGILGLSQPQAADPGAGFQRAVR